MCVHKCACARARMRSCTFDNTPPPPKVLKLAALGLPPPPPPPPPQYRKASYAYDLTYRGSELGKSDQIRGVEHFIAYRNEFNKFNNTAARKFNSNHHMALKLHFGMNTLCTQHSYERQ